MRRYLPLVFCVFFILPAVLYGQSPANPLPDLDGAVKDIAAGIGKKIPPGAAQKIVVGPWVYQYSIPPLGSYWAVQLTEELTNLPGRSFTLVSGGSAGLGTTAAGTAVAGTTAADLTVSGEIVEIAGVIRIYTRLIRTGSNAVEAALHWDFAADPYTTAMLLSSGSSLPLPWDPYEIDSPENPLLAEIAAAGNGPLISRTIHDENDADYFLLAPDQDGALVTETTGDMDTVMTFLEADSARVLREDDDGGSGGNARIRHAVQAGVRYIAKVQGFSDSTGSYGFRSYFVEQISIVPDEYENDDDFFSAKSISPGTTQQHSFHSSGDVDWVVFEVQRAGSYTILARGVNSSQLDTYIELYDADRNVIGDDDDGGEYLDSSLTANLQPGIYYVRVECLDEEPEEPYRLTLRAD
jgi:hypothetical protein